MKNAIRKQMLARRKHCGSRERAAAQQRIAEQLAGMEELKHVNTLAAYLAFGGEVDLDAFLENWLRQGRTLALPKFSPRKKRYEMAPVANLEKDTAPGKYGIREPLEHKSTRTASPMEMDVQVWLVPGVAFDLSGNRLGRGGGHYDRLLLNTPGWKIGIAYDWQIVASVPTDRHDVPMNAVITEKRTIRCSPISREGQRQP